MEEQVVKNKTNKGIYILVGVLLAIIVGLLAYIGYDKGLFGKEVVEEPQTNIQEETEKVEDKEVELSTEEIARVTEIAEKLNNGFAIHYPITDVSTINNQDLLKLGSDGLYDFNTVNTFTAAQVEANVKKYFGNSVTVKHEGIKCFADEVEPLFVYDGAGTYSYNPKHAGHGGISNKSAYTFYELGNKKGNTITVNFKVIYKDVPGIGPSSKLYANYSDATPIYTQPNADINPLTKEIASQYKTQVPTTTYTFELSEDGIYSIKTIEIK